MKSFLSPLIFLVFLILAGCSEPQKATDPLAVALILNEESKSKFLKSAKQSQQANIALAYARIGRFDEAKQVIEQINTPYHKVWAMHIGATLLQEQGKKLEAEQFMSQSLALAKTTQWETDKDNDFAFQALMRSLGKMQQYEKAQSLIPLFKRPDMQILSIDGVIREAVEVRDFDAAKIFLDLGVAQGYELLKKHPKLSRSIEFLSWGYWEIGELDQARELLKNLAKHDMQREIEESENVKYSFPYFQKLLYLEQYDLAIEVKRFIKDQIANKKKSRFMLDADLALLDADIAVVYVLKDRENLESAIQQIKELSDLSTRLYAYQYAAKKLHAKNRTEEASVLLGLAKEEVIEMKEGQANRQLNSALSLASNFSLIGQRDDAGEMLKVAGHAVTFREKKEEHLTTWLRIAKQYFSMQEINAAEEYLAKVRGGLSSISNGRQKDKIIEDMAKLYIDLGHEGQYLELLPLLKGSSNYTSVINEVVEAARKKGDFNAALKYTAEIPYRSTVIQNLRFLAQDMHNQEYSLNKNDLELLAEIVKGKYD